MLVYRLGDSSSRLHGWKIQKFNTEGKESCSRGERKGIKIGLFVIRE